MAQAESEQPDLDAEELMHLALEAMKHDRDDEALLFLKRALAQEPEDGRVHYLLGALHAALGMTGRAITEMTRATELRPDLGLARFQLGLLHMTAGESEQARSAWVPLNQLSEDDALRVFGDGMTRFLDADYGAAIALLKRGIELDESAESLNANMMQVIEHAQAALEAQTQSANAAAPSPPSLPQHDQRVVPDLQHVLFAAYRTQDQKPQ